MKWEVNHIAEAAKQNRIICGFNVFGYEDAQAVIKAAERAGAPILLMVNRDARRILQIEHWGALLGSLASAAKVPVAVHLDHCSEPEMIERAINAGFTSVMYDGSKLPVEENIANTARLAKLAHEKGVFIEAELGNVPYSDLGQTNVVLTDPEETVRMENETEVDWLAVSVGNIHRLTKTKVPIKFPELHVIEEKCSLPLVIHGSSGVVQEDLMKLKKERVGKVNIGTALRMAFGNALRAEMEARPEEFDRLKLFEVPVARVEEEAYRIINMLWQEEK